MAAMAAAMPMRKHLVHKRKRVSKKAARGKARRRR